MRFLKVVILNIKKLKIISYNFNNASISDLSSNHCKSYYNNFFRAQSRYLLIIVLILPMFSCEVDNRNPQKDYKKFEYKLESSKKSDDVNGIIKDSIRSKLNIKESFLGFQFGDSKALVEKKTINYLRDGKLVKEVPYFGAQYKSLLYKLNLRESLIKFEVDFAYTNKNELYKVELQSANPPLSTNYYSILDFNEIVNLYKDKYKTQWHYNKYISVTSTVERIDYENIEGNRYICLIFFGDIITITYKNLTFEEKMKEDKLNTTKDDI